MSFSFNIPNTPPANKLNATPAFTFGAAPSNTTNTTTAGNTSSAPFTFGAQNGNNALPTPGASASSFQFGGAPAASNSLFAQAPQQPQTSGLFSAQPATASTGGFSFGQNQPQQPQSSFSLGQTQAQPQSSFSLGQPQQQPSSFSLGQPTSSFSLGGGGGVGGGGLFGNQTSSIPQIASTPAPFPRDTKFSELPQDLKTSLEQLEKTIRENSSKLMLLPANQSGSDFKNVQDFEAKLNQVQAVLDARRDTLKELRRKMNYYWRYAENTAQALLASKSVTTDGRSVYKVPPMTPGLDPLERSVEELEGQMATLNRLGTVARRRLDSLLSPPRPLEETIPNSIKSQVQAVEALTRKIEEMEKGIPEEKVKYQEFLRKYRNFYQDPFNPTNTNTATTL